LQFSDCLRQCFAKFHLVVGRFYVAGVFIGAPLGLYIQYYEERMGATRSFSFAALTDAAIWMLTTAIAIFFILKGKIQFHRQWMTRSFAVAIVFLEGRFVSGVMGWDNSGQAVSEPSSGCAWPFLYSSPILSFSDRISPSLAPRQQS
jgi:uncharacterized membrane protein